ncbi:MAG: TatD family hydrolase [Oscillospiraceae bacterium]
MSDNRVFYSGIFDTHAHYDDEVFAPNLSEVLSVQRENGVVGIINCGSDEASSLRSAELAKEYTFVYAAVGVHPQEAENLSDGWLDRIAAMAALPKVCAIGEIGLDYYRDYPSRDRQQEVFRKQVELANSLCLPVQIHDRDAHGDTLCILKELKPKGCVHRFSGSPEMAFELVKIGMYIGVGGALTYKNAKKEVETVRQIPLEHIILETDCPFLAPQEFRGKVATSDMLSCVVDKISELKGISPKEVVAATLQNAKRAFRL